MHTLMNRLRQTPINVTLGLPWVKETGFGLSWLFPNESHLPVVRVGQQCDLRKLRVDLFQNTTWAFSLR